MSSAARAKKTAEVRRLGTIASAAEAKAHSAKKELRAAKANLKKARRLSKQSKKAAKEARKRAEVVSAALKLRLAKAAAAPAKAKPTSAKAAPPKAHAPAIQKSKRVGRPVRTRMPTARSPAAVARSVIKRLNGVPPIVPIVSTDSLAPKPAPSTKYGAGAAATAHKSAVVAAIGTGPAGAVESGAP
jgi:hypothetical protein